ncbi:unnamed protein product [Lupinus luteus]|uniref:Uncharacterized protein n=1 Tax=Lupinus luteus TaxID=3873 RepID=A0AAV1YKE0_LUPLU
MEFEKAYYVRNIVSPFEYDEFYYNKFIVHFKILASTLKDIVPSIEHFADTYNMVAVDHVHLFGSLNKFTILPSHFHDKTRMKEGIIIKALNLTTWAIVETVFSAPVLAWVEFSARLESCLIITYSYYGP